MSASGQRVAHRESRRRAAGRREIERTGLASTGVCSVIAAALASVDFVLAVIAMTFTPRRAAAAAEG